MSTVVTDVYSDLAMNCPASYYGGRKPARLLSVGDAESALSDWFTGDIHASTFRYTISDYDRRFRAQLSSDEDRYWTRPQTFRIVSRATRAVLGRPYTAFVGPIVDVQPAIPLGLEVTLADLVTAGFLEDKFQTPWRLIRDGFLDQLDAISELLDLEQPEPILYGRHRRTVDDPSTAEGYRILPIYLGIETVGASQYHVWMNAGHACKEVRIFVDDVERFEADGWLIPGNANWEAAFGSLHYVDKVSSTYGVPRRYSLIYGPYGGVGGSALSNWARRRTSEADKVAIGDKTLTASIKGVEEEGDGTGEELLEGFAQYRHFVINFLARKGPDSYQSGAWLTNPLYETINESVEKVDVSSFEEGAAIALERAPSLGGYVRAAAIGIKPGDRVSAKQRIADWNRSLGCRSGQTRPGQFGVVLLHPTEAIKAAAPLYTDAREILDKSFTPSILWDQHAISIPFRTDYDQNSGTWKTAGVATDSGLVELYEQDKDGAIREYPYAPGVAESLHLATLERLIRQHPPRAIRLSEAIGGDPGVNSLVYRTPGRYLRYIHFDSVSQTRSIRLAQVERRRINGSARTVTVEAIDVEDYIGYDMEDAAS